MRNKCPIKRVRRLQKLQKQKSKKPYIIFQFTDTSITLKLKINNSITSNIKLPRLK
jgi:hypothetical protein